MLVGLLIALLLVGLLTGAKTAIVVGECARIVVVKVGIERMGAIRLSFGPKSRKFHVHEPQISHTTLFAQLKNNTSFIRSRHILDDSSIGHTPGALVGDISVVKKSFCRIAVGKTIANVVLKLHARLGVPRLVSLASFERVLLLLLTAVLMLQDVVLLVRLRIIRKRFLVVVIAGTHKRFLCSGCPKHFCAPSARFSASSIEWELGREGVFIAHRVSQNKIARRREELRGHKNSNERRWTVSHDNAYCFGRLATRGGCEDEQ